MSRGYAYFDLDAIKSNQHRIATCVSLFIVVNEVTYFVDCRYVKITGTLNCIVYACGMLLYVQGLSSYDKFWRVDI